MTERTRPFCRFHCGHKFHKPKKQPDYSNMQSSLIREAKPLDIILSRGPNLSEREGNKKLRELARLHAQR